MSRNLSDFAPVLLRFSLAAVFAWFGANQLASPSTWTSMVPEWATSLSHMSASTFIQVNSVFEIIAALLLVLGVYVRWVALLLGIHLLFIAHELGINPVGVRDYGLAFATLALSLFGQDKYCLMKKED